MSKQQKESSAVKHTTELNPQLLADVRGSIVVIRDTPVIADAETQEILLTI